MLANQHRLSRANPIDWEIRTPLGTFTTGDRATWCTEPGGWTAELRRSKNGRHWLLAVFEAGVSSRSVAIAWRASIDADSTVVGQPPTPGSRRRRGV